MSIPFLTFCKKKDDLTGPSKCSAAGAHATAAPIGPYSRCRTCVNGDHGSQSKIGFLLQRFPETANSHQISVGRVDAPVPSVAVVISLIWPCLLDPDIARLALGK